MKTLEKGEKWEDLLPERKLCRLSKLEVDSKGCVSLKGSHRSYSGLPKSVLKGACFWECFCVFHLIFYLGAVVLDVTLIIVGPATRHS